MRRQQRAPPQPPSWCRWRAQSVSDAALPEEAMHSSNTRRGRDNQLSHFSALAPRVPAMKTATLATARVQDVHA